MIGRLSGVFEHTVTFGFFLFLFILGMLLAARQFGNFIRPSAQSLGSTLEAA